MALRRSVLNLPCARCGIEPRHRDSYCRVCSNNIRYENNRKKSKCNNCGINQKIPGGGNRYCEECRLIVKAKWAQEWQNSGKATKSARKWKFKIQEGDIEFLTLSQGNRCAICELVMRDTPHMDHDHRCCIGKGQKTCGKCIRGILCENCNKGIGLMKDDPRILVNAANYIKRYL